MVSSCSLLAVPTLVLLLASSLPTSLAQQDLGTPSTGSTDPWTHSFSNVRLPHHPAVRSYSTHTYYVLELDPRSSLPPRDAADRLGAELVERVGELDDHYLVRKKLNHLGKRDDSVWTHWEGKKTRRAFGGAGDGLRGAVRALEEMSPKQRVKRSWDEPRPVKRMERRIIGRQEDEQPKEDMTEIEHLVSTSATQPR